MDTLTYHIRLADKERLERLYETLNLLIKITENGEDLMHIKPKEITAVLSVVLQELGIATFNIKKLEIN